MFSHCPDDPRQNTGYCRGLFCGLQRIRSLPGFRTGPIRSCSLRLSCCFIRSLRLDCIHLLCILQAPADLVLLIFDLYQLFAIGFF